MSFLISLIPLLMIGFLYVWYLRLAARWTLKISLSRKLAWIFVAIVFIVSMLVRRFLSLEGIPVATIAGMALHLAFGSLFFGNFAIDQDRKRPKIIGGLKMTSVAMALLLATVGALFFAVNILQKNVPAS
ncbi:hypothetical protein [Collimonas sp. OK412]|jgi:fucose 4-O-acetylase-like acetyltransferase|uniref:hypothetical protein n=1 Tax=Collimonas sp. (strain OK412) TaxID=1801619 RepID=UPI000B88A362|nr:hypothetical protein [Collimonas sp. OK412]